MRVSFLRKIPLKIFWHPGNYTQHQEARFHKIIAKETKATAAISFITQTDQLEGF